MRYDTLAVLGQDAERVSNGVAANQSQESLDDQLKDLHVLATRFGLYDAGDWLKELIGHRDQFQRDYGKLPSREEITDRVNRSLDPTFPIEAGRLS